MSKFITISYGNGAIYSISLDPIARDRAKYYAECDPETTYQEEFDFAMVDKYAAYDWLRNNCDGEFLRSNLVEIKGPDTFDPVCAMDDAATRYDQ